MSILCNNIKQEPESCSDNEESVDLSSKNDKNIENYEKTPKSPDIRPEFVNIKMEISIDSIKSEPSSDHEEDSQSWRLDNSANNAGSKGNPSTGSLVEIVIKPEPVDSDEDQEDGSNQLEGSDNEELNAHSTADGKYMCPICQKRFPTKGHEQRHQTLHNKEKLVCGICSKNFLKIGHLKRHILLHSIVKPYECQECGKKFRTTSNLEQHKRIHLPVKPFECDNCGKRFAVKGNLMKHQGRSRCKKPIDHPIVCNVCHKVFKKEFLLRSHLRRHTTEKPYHCESCNMNFKYKSTLMRHTQLHNGIKPYSCKICMKTFTHAGLIKPHMRKHTGEKPYTCPICSKLFAHKHNMERHALRHAKVKRLECDVCHKKFPKESRLVYHMRIHTNEKPFACEVCPKKFSHKQNVIRHYSRKHPGEVYSCPDTDASVARDVWDNVVMQNSVFDTDIPVDNSGEYVIP